MLTVAPADPDSPDVRVLLGELGAALAAITGSDAGRFMLAALERQASAFGYTHLS